MRELMQGVALAMCLAGAGAGAAAAQDGRLAVTGEGVISVEPDVAVVRMGAVAEANTPDGAVAGMSDALAPVLVGLIEDGIEARDIQTGSLSLRPVYADRDPARDQDGPRIVGYEAASSLSVTVRALDGLGGVLSRAVSSGSNTFDGISWELSNPAAAEDAALAAAVVDAARKAALMAGAAGVALDGIVELREGGAQMAPAPMMMESRMAADVPVARGSLDVRASVSVVYSLLDQ